jgi:radical SAM superfamily enzyme YgiQ (UPF0313 family)
MDRIRLLNAERTRLRLPRHGRVRIGVGYPNTYRVAMSSLAYQWVIEIAAAQPEVAVERFFADSGLAGSTLESGTPLGDLDLLAWSCSFELDAVNLLRTLDAAGIPRRREDRSDRDPLLVVGGPVASINPLPLAPVVDVFVLGAAELLWPRLIGLTADLSNDQLLDELADLDGYFVPRAHLDAAGQPRRRLRRVEKRDRQMSDPAMIPSSWVVTQNTEYARRGLVEMSRGCPEKCRYCWVSHNDGRLRCYPVEAIHDRVRQLREITDRVGFVATAVGDHPELPELLDRSRSLGLQVAVSSLRIPAMVPEVLDPLAACGARSITIAPETGSDRLRRRLNKPISNDAILEAVETAQRCGIESLKMYFIIGLPDETDRDLEAIVDLVRRAHAIHRSYGSGRGRMGRLQVGINLLVPKPYTPFSRVPMLTRREASRRLDLVRHGLSGLPNLTIDRPSYRESIWQGCLSRGDARVLASLESLADGAGLSSVLRDSVELVDELALSAVEGSPVWQFVSSAPTRNSEFGIRNSETVVGR